MGLTVDVSMHGVPVADGEERLISEMLKMNRQSKIMYMDNTADVFAFGW